MAGMNKPRMSTLTITNTLTGESKTIDIPEFWSIGLRQWVESVLCMLDVPADMVETSIHAVGSEIKKH